MAHKKPSPEDPLELVGVSLPVPNAEMLTVKAECLAEEFLRMGRSPESVARIFKNPFYAGAHELYLALGDAGTWNAIAKASRLVRPGYDV